jgi:uncharacterized protein involved in exopolysaccharide biosynthesis
MENLRDQDSKPFGQSAVLPPERSGMQTESPIPLSRPSVVLTVLESAFRFKRLLVWTFVVCVLGVAAFTLLTPRQYRSEMKFIMQSARSSAVISPDRTTSSMLASVSEEQLNSELAMLQSEDVLSKVADPGWDPALARTRSKAELKQHAKLLTSFTKHLTVDPIGKSDVMSLSFGASSAAEAQDTLNRLAAAYLDQHERLQRRSGTASFYEEQAARYKEQWNAAVNNLVAFQNAHHLVSVQDVEESLEKALADDEAALRINATHLNETAAAMATAKDALAGVPNRQQTQNRTVPSQLLVQQLKTQLVGLNNHRTELLTRYTPSNRLVAEVDQQIADTNRAIENASAEESHEATTDINPTWQHLKTAMVDNEVEYSSLTGGRASLQQELGGIRSQLAAVQLLAPTFEQLRSNAEQAQANYEAFLEKRDRADVDDALDAHKFLNVSVLETPTLPYTPAKPKPLLNALLGIPTALFLAICLVYLAEAGRQTFATPEELEAAMRQPVLATVTHFNQQDPWEFSS